MDLYSIQNSGGEVYGVFDMPAEDNLPAWEWEGRLTAELGDILGINGVRAGRINWRGEDKDRVVIDLDPFKATDENVDRVHMAVGYICLAENAPR